MDLTRRIELDTTYDDAITYVKEALKEQGFGVLTEIDVRQTLKDKLGIDVDAQTMVRETERRCHGRHLDPAAAGTRTPRGTSGSLVGAENGAFRAPLDVARAQRMGPDFRRNQRTTMAWG